MAGSCLGDYKNKSSAESFTSPEAKYCSGHTDSPFSKDYERKQQYNMKLLLSCLEGPLVVMAYKRLPKEQKRRKKKPAE